VIFIKMIPACHFEATVMIAIVKNKFVKENKDKGLREAKNLN
jgi:hypothetical protein